MQRKLFVILGALILIVGLIGFSAGCASSPAAPSAPVTSSAPETSSVPATTSAPATSVAPATSSVPTTSSAPASTAAGNPIKIGLLACYTGSSSDTNPWILAGVKLAIHQFGGSVDGRPIQLITEDAASDPTTSVDKARILVEQDKVDVLIGPLPADCTTAVATYDATAKVPLIGICEQIPGTQGLGDWFFAPDGTHFGAGYYVGLYAYDVLGYRTATVVNDNIVFAEDFTQGAMDAFVSRGGKIVQRQRPPVMAPDYASYLSNLQKADATFFWMVPVDALKFVEQYNSYGIKQPLVIAGCSILEGPMLNQLGDEGLGLVSCSEVDGGVNTPAVQQFDKDWSTFNAGLTEAQGKNPDDYEGVSAYQSTYAALSAIQSTNGDTTPSVLDPAIEKLNIDTPWGKLSFDQQGIGIASEYIMKVVKQGDQYVRTDVKTYNQVTRAEPASAKGAAPTM